MPDGKTRAAPFTVPIDALRKLGNGDAAAGQAALADTLGFLAVRVGEVPADVVVEVGNGDPLVGRQVLSRFVAKVRATRAKAT